ncbi:hypothetical protein JHS3_30610 [Jeongeupia sp. HS-3]|nr:hypothetical protein JHS3_30610 [Jeongeupia sp. HS-3]
MGKQQTANPDTSTGRSDNHIFNNRERLRLEHDVVAQGYQGGAANACLNFGNKERGIGITGNMRNPLGLDSDLGTADQLGVQALNAFGVFRHRPSNAHR